MEGGPRGGVEAKQATNSDQPSNQPTNRLITNKPTTEKITYYLLGAWEKEKGGIKTREEFFNYLDELLSELDNHGEL